MYLTGVHLMGVYLINVHLTGMHLMGVHLTGVHLIGVYLTGMHLTGVYLIGVYLIGVHHRMQPFLLSRTYVFAAFGGPGLMPRFSFFALSGNLALTNAGLQSGLLDSV
jgi:Pentapeptide repeats (8 copies)